MKKRIGVLTSGGDAPGMNAAVRAVVRTGIHYGMEVMSIERGFEGLLHGEIEPMGLASVGDIMQRGGTVIKTARSDIFKTKEGQDIAEVILHEFEIDTLVVIGGDGSMKGALELSKKGIVTMCVPGTIDNDMGYTDYTIGFDTAVNTVLSAISNIRDTASSHDRTTIVEVMGRNCGDIALQSGLTGGAEYILIPEIPVDVDAICEKIDQSVKRKKTHSIIIKAEGAGIMTDELVDIIEDKTGQEVRKVVLAYLQRGGSPSARDRMLATLMGSRAVELIAADVGSRAIGINEGRIVDHNLQEAVETKKEADLQLLKLIDILSK